MRDDEIELILKTVRSLWSRIRANVEEIDFRQLSFQLTERLSNATKRMAEVKKYLKSVREWTRKPYMMPLEECLGGVGESLEEVCVGSTVSSVAFLPDPSRVVVGVKSGEALIVDARPAEIVKRYVGHKEKVTSVLVSEDGRWMVSGSDNGTVRRWNVEGAVDIGDPLVGHEGSVLSVAMYEEHDLAASGGEDGTVRLWRLGDGELIGEPLCVHEGRVTSAAISNNSQNIVSCSHDKTIRVWNARAGKEVMKLLCDHKTVPTSVAFSRNNQYIVSGSSDKTVRLWDKSGGKEVREPLCGHEFDVTSVAVSGDYRLIVSASSDRTVRL